MKKKLPGLYSVISSFDVAYGKVNSLYYTMTKGEGLLLLLLNDLVDLNFLVSYNSHYVVLAIL